MRRAVGMCPEQIAAEHLPDELARDLDRAFERVILTYQHQLFLFALRYSADRRDAEEIAQDALVRAYRALCDYTPERIRALALRPWLYQIALNVARNRARGREIRMAPLLADHENGSIEAIEPAAPEAESPVAVAERLDESARLAAHLAALPARYRAAVILRHVVGLGYAELATVLGQPVGTVKAHVHRGVALLRAGYPPEVGGGFADQHQERDDERTRAARPERSTPPGARVTRPRAG